MKRYLLLFIILLLPILVNAKTCDTSKVKITSIKMVDKSESVIENKEADFKGLQANLNLKFNTQGEHIEYKIIVKNENSNDFELNKNDVKTDYFNYKYIYNDNTPIVKANSEKQINLRIDYYHSVPEELRNSFIEEKQIVLNLSNDKQITNPKTSRTTVIGLILVLLGLSTIIFVSKNKKEPALLLLLVLLLPVGVFALCNVSITTNSKIEIGKEIKEFCYQSNNEIPQEFREYVSDMTWNEYFTSDYNKEEALNNMPKYYFDPGPIDMEFEFINNRPNRFNKTNCTENCLEVVNREDKILDKSIGCYTQTIYH